MPFDNLTPDEEMGTLVRNSFYNHFSSKNYRDIELSTVDRALESIQRTQAGTWREVPPETLGKYLHADYVMYGKVKDFQKLLRGLLPDCSDCRSGDSGVQKWKGRLVEDGNQTVPRRRDPH